MTHSNSILIIEDDELLREIYTTKLRMEGYNVETAIDGLEGLQKANALDPDLILLDMLMPKMSGLEFLQAYRPRLSSSATMVVVISNKSSLHDINQAKTMGAKDYLIKSHHTPQEIALKIRGYLED